MLQFKRFEGWIWSLCKCVCCNPVLLDMIILCSDWSGGCGDHVWWSHRPADPSPGGSREPGHGTEHDDGRWPTSVLPLPGWQGWCSGPGGARSTLLPGGTWRGDQPRGIHRVNVAPTDTVNS